MFCARSVDGAMAGNMAASKIRAEQILAKHILFV
jgi:hypothetical protein